jgi:long-chain acyl-CoA synthetase
MDKDMDREPAPPAAATAAAAGGSSRTPPGSARRTSLVAAPSAASFSPTEIFRGRNVFILGSTGFVGKVLLGMLLDRFPQVGRVYVMVRRGSGTSSEARFWSSVVTSPAFDPLREKHGGAEGLEAHLRSKVRIVDGDITEKDLGLGEEEAARVAADVDVLLNSSGRVTFNPPLESALRTNVEGTKNVIAFARRMRRPALLHTSTCFVAGNRSGEIWEDEELVGYFPRRGELPGTTFSVEQEMADSERIAAAIRAEADDAQVLARLRQKARQRLRDESRDPDDEAVLRLAVARERKEWIRSEATRRGIERARAWGWPNIYTYTKSMGDQLVARATGVFRSIVRPAIVESAVEFPFRGWNEGFTTSAPLVYLALKGQNVLPVSDKLILDIVPVDHICAAMLMVAAQLMVEQPPLVHQLSSGDLNPGRIARIVTLTGLYKRKRFQGKETGNRFVNALAARMEFRPVTPEAYERGSLPLVNRLARRSSQALTGVRPDWGAGRFTEWLDRGIRGLREVARVTDEARENIEMFRPFILENAYVLRADHIRALRDRMPALDRKLLVWGPEDLDWYDYWMNIHFPGLERWVLPELDSTYAPKPKQVYGYHDLLELFDTTTKLHAARPALRIERGRREEIYTYADLQELATRAGAFLVGQGVKGGDRVILFAKNGPEWSMAYFGILKLGATVVPVANESTVAELVNIARASGATGLVIGDDLLDRRSQLPAALAEAEPGLTTRVWPFTEVFEIPDEAEERARAATLLGKVNPDTVASLIFTSGTTGKPKGVMLTHRNLTFMVAELSKVFEFGVNDGMLSVLPLHHTFEFSTGLLMPLARGAQITYLVELNGESIAGALKKGHVTSIVGVPALWDLLRRRVLQRFSERSPLLESAMRGLMTANYELRSRTGLDLGMLLFLPVHEGFGGRIRYLISGGSALSPEVLKSFVGMGFDFFEGYGLTETAPVLTVTSPKQKALPGSVGQPLPGVEVKIHEPDVTGVGEVIARGRNVMAGYWEDEVATGAAIQDGWFHTGDLGRFDADGNLYLVGRSKDLIVDSNGKNVYPDEIEELYGGCPWIKELSVVGVPEAGGEHVVAVVVPDYDVEPGPGAPAAGREAVLARIDEHVRKVSATLPFWKRIKTVHVWEGDLPKTAKRSVKRRDIVTELVRRRGDADVLSVRAGGPGEEAGIGWLLDIVAQVSGRARGEIHARSRLDQLGFDSLMYAELGVALEATSLSIPESTDFTAATDVYELHQLLRGRAIGGVGGAAGTVVDRSRSRGAGPGGGQRRGTGAGKDGEGADGPDVYVPGAVASVGKRALGLGQRLFYGKVLESRVLGRQHIPLHTNFIVAANHCSHLDMGLVKVALGAAGEGITSMAAADYFFRNRYRRAYFKNFTNLVPMERSGSIRKSMDTAESVLRQGRSMVVFPEGTRSLTGTVAEFLPSLGYLAVRSGVGILPAYIAGTFDALPKGAVVPRSRQVGVAFGPFLSSDDLGRLTDGLTAQEGWRLIAALTQRIVENLRDGAPTRLDFAAVRAAWDGRRLVSIPAGRGERPAGVDGAPPASPRRPRALRSLP